ncbi:MAG: membrane protein insertion efficiency factor YidD [Solirubrobacterales bacterium]
MTTPASVSRETCTCGDRHPATSVSRETEKLSPLARVVLLPLRGYRRFISPAMAPRCRYYPSCSAYAEEAIRELGAIRGTILASWRLLRCNPFSKGGIDPVSDRRLFRTSTESTRTA